MAAHDSPASENSTLFVVAVACSAGGLVALRRFVSLLPGRLPAAVVLLQHLSPDHPSHLLPLLQPSTSMPVKEARRGAVLREGVVYVATPNRHVLIEPGPVLGTSFAERVQFVRPSANVLFESLAVTCGDHAIAVVLTGSGSDGAAGIRRVKARGGTVIAQDEATSQHFGMPHAAIETGCVDLILPLDDIPPAISHLLSESKRQ